MMSRVMELLRCRRAFCYRIGRGSRCNFCVSSTFGFPPFTATLTLLRGLFPCLLQVTFQGLFVRLECGKDFRDCENRVSSLRHFNKKLPIAAQCAQRLRVV